MEMAPGAAAVEAIALYVEWSLPADIEEREAYCSPYARHEVVFLSQPRSSDAPLEFSVAVEDGAIRLEF